MIRANPLDGTLPTLDPSAYVDPSALVIGRVTIGAHASIWCHAVVRGDVHTIEIGEACNVQDMAVIHVTNNRFATRLGRRVSIGHSATLHGCTIEDGALVGIGAIVLDGATVGAESLVGAGALVTPGTVIPPRSLVLGSPARVKRPLEPDELAMVLRTPDNYIGYAAAYARALAQSRLD